MTTNNQNYMLRVFLIALFVTFLILIPPLIKDNGVFLYYGEYDTQQVPFYMQCHNAIRSGEFGFSLYKDLGVNFISFYSSYTLGSPFFWLTIPFPHYFVPYLMAFLTMIKFGLTAVTGYAYVRLFTKNQNTAVIGGLLYSFSGFNIYNIYYYNLQEMVLFFPLLLIGIEQIVKENKRYKFAIAVFICSIVNYQLFFAQAIFCIIYLVVRAKCDDFDLDLKSIAKLMIEATIGVMGSSVLLIPALLELISNIQSIEYIDGYDNFIYNESQKYGLIISSLFFPPDIPAVPNFFPDSNAQLSSVSLFLPMFGMTGVFTFFKYNGNHFIKRILKICIVIALIPILNSTFSAFSVDYYARWFYMPILIMTLATVLMLENDIDKLKYGLKKTTVFVLYFALIGILPQKNITGEYEWFSMPEDTSRFWIYVLISMCGLISVFALIQFRNSRYIHQITTISLCFIIIVYSSYMISIGKTYGQGYETIMTNGYNANIELPQSISSNNEFYRVDTISEVDNLEFYFDLMPSNSYYWSIPEGATEITEDEIGVLSLTNVLYSFVEPDAQNQESLLGFSYLNTQHGYDIYRNDYFIPFGVGYDYQITTQQLHQAGDFADRLLVSGIYLDDNNSDSNSNSDSDSNSNKLPTLIITEDYLSFLDDDKYLESCDKLAQNYLQKIEYNSHRFAGVYNALRNQVLFISIPYNKGFTATINGEPVEILKANGGFMAIEVETGINKVEFIYKTPGLNLGIQLSIFALILFILYIYVVIKRNNKISFRDELEELGINLDNNNIKNNIKEEF